MKLIETGHPFYKPLWRRIAIVAVIAAWVAFEFLVDGGPFWMTISLAFLGYAVWAFFIAWPREDTSS